MNFHVCLTANSCWSMYNYRKGVISDLIKQGYRVTIVAPHDETVTDLKSLGCDVVHVGISPKGVNPFTDLLFIFRLVKIYKAIRPNLVIHYTIKPNIYGSISAKVCAVKSIAVATGLGYAFVNDTIVSKIAKQLYRVACLFSQEVWFLNHDDLHTFVKSNLIAPDKAVLLHGEGVDVDYFLPATNNSDGNFRFLLISRMLWDKGIKEYVEAARLVKLKYPNAVFQLLGPCGVGNPSAIDKELIYKWQSEGLVEYLGITNDVRPIISNADCVVLPSYREGIPRTMLEAASMAKPLIVSDAPGCKDVVINEVSGLICQVRDVKSLAYAFERLLTMPECEIKNMGKAGRNYMINEFDEKFVIDKYAVTLKKYV